MDRATQLYEQYKRTKPKLTIDGVDYYLLEGDLLLSDLQLQVYCLEQAEREATAAEQREGLVAMATADGKIVRWAPGKALSYVVVRSTFPDEQSYARVVQAMRQAAGDWEGVCGVKFLHLREQDAALQPGQARPLFDVRFHDTQGAFIAVAFFPNDPVEQRHVFIDPSFFRTDLFYNPIGVLRHELGHVLGFRHEHIRSGAPADCPQEGTSDAINLTEYDPRSVMHYFCGGIGTQEMKLTEVDRQGAQAVYGPPQDKFQFFE
jgi:hypothetical protein